VVPRNCHGDELSTAASTMEMVMRHPAQASVTRITPLPMPVVNTLATIDSHSTMLGGYEFSLALMYSITVFPVARHALPIPGSPG